MPDPTQFDPYSIRVALDHGEVAELDGCTLVLGGEESSSVVLRLAPWHARLGARVLQEWSSVSRIFHQTSRPHLDELELSRMLELAAAALGDLDGPVMQSPRGSRIVPNRQRLATVAVLGERCPDRQGSGARESLRSPRPATPHDDPTPVTRPGQGAGRPACHRDDDPASGDRAVSHQRRRGCRNTSSPAGRRLSGQPPMPDSRRPAGHQPVDER